MIEVGVASPIAQGQAMISTATAATSASASPGPKQQPDRQRQRRRRHHRRHEIERHPVHQRLDRQLGALRLLDHADDLRQHRVGAHPRGAEPARRCR
jgi:hypothetical protein